MTAEWKIHNMGRRRPNSIPCGVHTGTTNSIWLQYLDVKILQIVHVVHPAHLLHIVHISHIFAQRLPKLWTRWPECAERSGMTMAHIVPWRARLATKDYGRWLYALFISIKILPVTSMINTSRQIKIDKWWVLCIYIIIYIYINLPEGTYGTFIGYSAGRIA